jgi:lipid II:glycine glycyltransferase (peptidoglycan interpeptide bridge formation enzyme)
VDENYINMNEEQLESLTELAAALRPLTSSPYTLYLEALKKQVDLMHCTIVTRHVDDELHERYARATEAAIRRLQRRLHKAREWEKNRDKLNRRAVERDIEERRIQLGAGQAAEASDEG